MLPTMVATLLNDLLSRVSRSVQIALLTLMKDLSGPTDMTRVWTRSIAMWKIPMGEEKKQEAMPMTIFLETELAQRKSQVICVSKIKIFCIYGPNMGALCGWWNQNRHHFFNHLAPLVTCLLFRLCDRTKRGVQFGKQWLYTIKVQHNPTGHRCPKQESCSKKSLSLGCAQDYYVPISSFHSLRKKKTFEDL